MNHLPLISIITPTFNQGQFIEETIKSVLSQSYPNIEYIIIDAMSTDDTPAIVNRYKDKIARIIREPDQGQSDAIIKGFEIAKGELVGWINSDDILHSNCVEMIVNEYIKNPNSILFYNSKIEIISDNGSFLRVEDAPLTDRDHLLRQRNKLTQPGSFYSKKALRAVNYFDRSLRFSMDLDLWLRLLQIGSAVNINSQPTAAYREWGGTKTSTGDTKLLRERKAMLLRHGAKPSDRSVRAIDYYLLKQFVKRIPFVSFLYRKMASPSS